MTFRLRRGMVAETGPDWAITGADGKPLPGRWADEATAREQGFLGIYLLSGVDVVEIPEPMCQRLRNYPVSDTRSMAGSKCERPATGTDAEGLPACSRHLAADKAAATRRANARADWHRFRQRGA